MSDATALQKLFAWLSPAFPVGAFAWSAGLETAIADRGVADSQTLQNWIAGMLAHGGLKTDAIVLAEAWRIALTPTPDPSPQGGGEPSSLPDPSSSMEGAAPSPPSPLRGGVGGGGSTLDMLDTLSTLALALTPAAERHAETTITGSNFAIAAAAWPTSTPVTLPDPCPYPVAVGALAAAHGIGLGETLLAFLTATVHGQVSVAVRLIPLGQTDGLAVMAALEPEIAALARFAETAGLAEIGGIAYAAEIAQLRHETLEPRIFRS